MADFRHGADLMHPVGQVLLTLTSAVAAPPLDAYTTGLTGAWSMSRQLLTAYGGSFYTNSSGTVSTVFDQSGNSRNLGGTAGSRPVPATQGGIAVADFTPNTQVLESAVNMSTFITGSAGFVVLIVYVDALVTTQSVLLYDGASIDMQISILTASSQASFYNDGGAVSVSSAATAVSVPSANVLAWRHEGGVLYGSVNGGTEVSATSGNTTPMSGKLTLGRLTSFGFDGKLYECYVWNTVPSSGDRTAIIAQAKTYVGIP